MVQHVMEAARLYGSKVVATGSMSEYGAHATPLKEDLCFEPSEATNCYALAKLSSGIVMRSLAKKYNVVTTVARLFGVFGPGESANRLFPTLREKLLNGESVDLSDGKQRRDFIHIGDVCEALYRLLLT